MHANVSPRSLYGHIRSVNLQAFVFCAIQLCHMHYLSKHHYNTKSMESFSSKLRYDSYIPLPRVHDLRHSHVSLLIEMGFNIIVISKRVGHKDVSVTLDTYGHLYPGKDKEVALGLHSANANGLVSGQGTMEAQLYSLMTEIKSSLPAISTTYENDDVIVWDCKTKRKNIISFQDLPPMLTLKPDPEAAYETIINEGYLELTPDTILCFSKRGMPTQYL